MKCGHCGTTINDGYSTCPACGAVYRKRPSLFAETIRFMGGAFGLFGLVEIVSTSNGNDRDVGIALALVGAAVFLFGNRLIVRTPYLWYRREP